MAKGPEILKSFDKDGQTWQSVRIIITENQGQSNERKIPHDFDRPADFKALMAYGIAGGDEGEQEVYDRWYYAEDLKQRASKRESAAVVLPVVATSRYGKLDLVTGTFDGGDPKVEGAVRWEGQPLELAKRLAYINQSMEMGPSRAVKAAREQLLASKAAREVNGALRAS